MCHTDLLIKEESKTHIQCRNACMIFNSKHCTNTFIFLLWISMLMIVTELMMINAMRYWKRIYTQSLRQWRCSSGHHIAKWHHRMSILLRSIRSRRLRIRWTDIHHLSRCLQLTLRLKLHRIIIQFMRGRTAWTHRSQMHFVFNLRMLFQIIFRQFCLLLLCKFRKCIRQLRWW